MAVRSKRTSTLMHPRMVHQSCTRRRMTAAHHSAMHVCMHTLGLFGPLWTAEALLRAPGSLCAGNAPRHAPGLQSAMQQLTSERPVSQQSFRTCVRNVIRCTSATLSLVQLCCRASGHADVPGQMHAPSCCRHADSAGTVVASGGLSARGYLRSRTAPQQRLWRVDDCRRHQPRGAQRNATPLTQERPVASCTRPSKRIQGLILSGKR
jgi:hypothetical protein